MIGWLSNPFVTLLYAMEQAEILFFGHTPRASDLRILISFTVHSVFVIIFSKSDVKDNADLTLVYAIVAYLTSKNYMHTFGLKKPYNIESEEMQRNKTHAEVVFGNLEASEENENLKRSESRWCPTMTMIFNVVSGAAVILAAIVFQGLFIDEGEAGVEVVFDWTADNTD